MGANAGVKRLGLGRESSNNGTWRQIRGTTEARKVTLHGHGQYHCHSSLTFPFFTTEIPLEKLALEGRENGTSSGVRML